MPVRWKRFRGHGWMIRKYGLRRWWRYRVAYKGGMTIDYAEIYTANELAILSEHSVPAPWEAK